MANAARARVPEIGPYHPDEDFYQLIDLEPDATSDQIRKAHRKRMQAVHPDRGGSHRHAATLNHARDTLLDPQLRQSYDAQRTAWHQALQRARKLAAKRSARAAPATPPLRLFTLLADQDVVRALSFGDWRTALGLAVLGRFGDWLVDVTTAGDPIRAAMLRQIGAQVHAVQLPHWIALSRDLQTHQATRQPPLPSEEVIDLDALVASISEVFRGDALTPRSVSRPTVKKRAKTRPARAARQQRRNP